MEIKIEKPFCLHLDVVATDENVPSMRMQVMIDVHQFGHRLEYRGSVWFDCSVWDAFVASLNGIDEGKSELMDMGGHFTLWLRVVSGKPVVSWEMKKADLTGVIATAAFHSPIDEDTLAHIKNQFTQFERWW
jgi:hypothetical protein